MRNYTLVSLEETHSTQEYLKEWCAKDDLKNFTTVVSAYQSAGKGQRGNHWESERGKNLMFSTVVFPHFLHPSQQFIISQIVALSIAEVLSDFTDGISIKWPNDIYWRNEKIAGILIEHELCNSSLVRTIIGAGININQTLFVSDAPNPVSLKSITGCDYDILKILDAVMNRLVNYYQQISMAEDRLLDFLRDKYLGCLFRKNGYYLYKDKNGLFDACITSVDEKGQLHLTDKDGNARTYLFKEVQYIL